MPRGSNILPRAEMRSTMLKVFRVIMPTNQRIKSRAHSGQIENRHHERPLLPVAPLITIYEKSQPKGAFHELSEYISKTRQFFELP